MKTVNYKDPVGEEIMLMALIQCPDDKDAVAYLAGEGYLASEIMCANKRVSKAADLDQLRVRLSEQREKVRREIAPKREEGVTLDMLDEVVDLTAVMQLATQRVEEKLRANTIVDAAKALRDLSQVRTQTIDKKLALEGRPTSITESRTTDELVRSLEALGVAKQIEAG